MATTNLAELRNNQGTAVAKREATFSTFIAGEGVKRKINEIIGGKKGDGFITSIVSAVSTNPMLADCDHGTILSAGLQGAALDLSPSQALGHFYFVPFEDRKNNRKVAQFQLGYKGYIQLAIRSGQYRRINVIALKDGELVNYNPLTEEIFTKLIEDDARREAAPTIGYYAMFELMNGFMKTMYWSKEKMERHAVQYSKGYAAKKGYTFWEKNFDGMAMKTMLRQLLGKWGVMSIEMQTAFNADMGVIDGSGKPSYVDNGGTAPLDLMDDVPVDVEHTEVKDAEKALEAGRHPDAGGDDVASFKEVAELINKATTEEQLNEALDLARTVPVIHNPAELFDLGEKRRAELTKPAKPAGNGRARGQMNID